RRGVQGVGRLFRQVPALVVLAGLHVVFQFRLRLGAVLRWAELLLGSHHRAGGPGWVDPLLAAVRLSGNDGLVRAGADAADVVTPLVDRAPLRGGAVLRNELERPPLDRLPVVGDRAAHLAGPGPEAAQGGQKNPGANEQHRGTLPSHTKALRSIRR